jgi:glycine cleavage system transcriptional repressor
MAIDQWPIGIWFSGAFVVTIPSFMKEKQQLILTASGPDRVGLVEKLSEFISSRACNIEDSKMAAFYGEFAIILLISGDEGRLAQIARDYRDLESQTGLRIAIKSPSPRSKTEAFIPCRLTAACMDHPGIVHKISGVLSGLAVNIESMETKTYFAPMSGTPLFQLEADLSVPVRTNINQLRERLAEIQSEENIDIEITVIKG